MEIGIQRLNEKFLVEIDGYKLTNVSKYRVKSNSNGKFELILNMELDVEFMGLTVLEQHAREFKPD